jgi:outer membrane protein
MRWIVPLASWLAVGMAAQVAIAAPAKLTLEQVIAKAVANPRVQMAERERAAAAAQVAEADAARYPRMRATAFGTISPEINCLDPICSMTSPQNFAFRFSGLYGNAQVDVTQPLYTFGKIAHARAAAQAGVEAQGALADEAAGDVASDAARAYWGLKVARELVAMLDDGIDEIAKVRGSYEERTDVTIPDRQRVAVLLAEAQAQRAEAALAEARALAGLRAVTGVHDADIDDAELAPVVRALPDPAQLAQVAERRPQRRAAISGARAGQELVEFQRAHYYPDLALVGSAVISRAQGVDDPPSVFANDPFNRVGAGVVLALQWQLEPWTVKARADRARAEAQRLAAQAELAAIGAVFDAQTALAEAIGAKAMVESREEGERAARTWLAAMLQAEAIGTADTRDLADAYLAWFQMRARWAQAVFEWNVAVVRLGRAGGEFRANDSRPR